MSELARGSRYLGRGLMFLRARPRLLLIGMLPALVVFAVLTAAFVLIVLHLGDLVSWATPFADDWAATVRSLVRVLLGLAFLGAVLLFFLSMFVGLTLTFGEPAYAHIWRVTEQSLGGMVPDHEVGFLESARDGIRLSAVGLACSAAVVVAGFVPVVGPAVGLLVGTTLSGRLVARELLARPLEARGLDAAAQARVLSPYRARVASFGIVTQLSFVVPFGAVVMMPAAVVGATMLARDMLEQPK